MDVFLNEGMPLRVGIGDVAGDLWDRDSIRQIGERLRRFVARLNLQLRPIDRTTVEPRGRAGFQTAEGEAAAVECSRQPDSGGFPHPAGWNASLTPVDQATQKSAGGQDDGSCCDLFALGRDDSCNTRFSIETKVSDFGLADFQVRLVGQDRLNGLKIEFAVGLCPGAADGRAFPTVEQTKLDAGTIDRTTHDAVQGVDLADQVSFTQSADGRVA